MPPARRLFWLFVLVLVACGGRESDPEGRCFDPGEACGAGFCSQSGYCAQGERCVSKLVDGSACSEPRQCTGDRCDTGRCTGGAGRVRRGFRPLDHAAIRITPPILCLFAHGTGDRRTPPSVLR
jgi:hypothetical protein